MAIRLSKRVKGQWNVDWERRVDFAELRRERLARLQERMKAHDLGALLLYEPSNIRYATGTRWLHLFTLHQFYRYCLVPDCGDPVLFETAGVEFENRRQNNPWVAERMKPAIIWQFSGPATQPQIDRWVEGLLETLEELGVSGRKVGIDRLDLKALRSLEKRGVEVVDCWDAVWEAMVVKTEDEKELIRQAAAIYDAALYRAKEELKPGMRECDLAGVLADTLFRLGVEDIEVIALASGIHTNPYLREFSDKIIRPGDMVIIDVNAAGPGGFYMDYGRILLCGEVASDEQKRLYKQAYEWVYQALEVVKPGVTTDQVARKFPEYADDQYGTMTLVQFGHGVGIGFYEPPMITRGFSLDYPQEIQEGQCMAIETYAAGEEEGVRVEEQFFVVKDGIEIISRFPHEKTLMEYVDEKYIYHPESRRG